MGFCFFNNIAVAAAHALTAHGLSRVAIIDFDVHHGNGTEDCFKDNDQVLMVSMFQHPFYPYSGAEKPAPNMLNVPMPRGTGSEEFRQMVTELWLPRLRAFKPEMILISAGFDAHHEDDLGGMKLHEKDYTWMTEQLKQVAEETAKGRIVSMLEGGYVPVSYTHLDVYKRHRQHHGQQPRNGAVVKRGGLSGLGHTERGFPGRRYGGCVPDPVQFRRRADAARNLSLIHI